MRGGIDEYAMEGAMIAVHVLSMCTVMGLSETSGVASALMSQSYSSSLLEFPLVVNGNDILSFVARSNSYCSQLKLVW
jgi:hypothetical protein